MSIKKILAFAFSIFTAFYISPIQSSTGVQFSYVPQTQTQLQSQPQPQPQPQLGALYSYADAAAAVDASSAASASSTSSASSASPQQEAADDPNLMAISPRNVNYSTQEVFIGALERSAGFDARLNYPHTMSVLIPREGMFVNMHVGNNDWIDEGEPLAVFSVQPNELEIDEATLALELAESSQRREIEALESALEDARSRLDALGASYEALYETIDADTDMAFDEAYNLAWSKPSELRRAELDVFTFEENLEFALYNGERDLEFMRGRLADLKERSEDFVVYAPISGFVYDLVYFTVGRSVSEGQFLCRISNPDLFQLIINAPNLSQLRLGAPVAIETSRRDAPTFGGRVVGNTNLLGRNESESRAVIAFDDPQAFIDFGEGSISRLTGLRYRVSIEQADIQNVLLAPRRAINTESSYRYVNMLEDGLSKKRYVLIGLTNIEYAQILDGLNPGDVLIMN